MRQKGVVFTTSLTTKDCASVFRTAAAQARGVGAKLGETFAKAMHNDNSGFFTPKLDDPFAAIDGVPDFAVGVFIGKFVSGGTGAGTAIHMYVADASNEREVQIVSPHTLTGGMRSAHFVQQFLEAFKRSDPNLVQKDGNI